MLQDTVFKLVDAGLPQMLGFLIYGGCIVGFIIYFVYLVWQQWCGCGAG